MSKRLPPAPELRRLFLYDPDTGTLTRRRVVERTGHDRRYNSLYAGKPAGWADAAGYSRVCINSQTFMASRVIWAMQTGVDIGDEVDHKDRDRSNNRWANLREATREQQMWNTGVYRSNSSGYRGVSKVRSNGKWMATIAIHGKNKNLGRFSTAEEAAQAYLVAEQLHRGEFSSTVQGRPS